MTLKKLTTIIACMRGTPRLSNRKYRYIVSACLLVVLVQMLYIFMRLVTSHVEYRTTTDLGFGPNNISCSHLWSGNTESITNASALMETYPRSFLLPMAYINITRNCTRYIVSRGYITTNINTEEENFPLAYSMLVYKHAEQVERLLRSIWRPNNHYCIHIDKKSSDEFKQGIGAIAGCFENVFVHPTSVDVIWAKFSMLQPELLCMEELWRRGRTWRYFINLTGQEFPLKTNYELTRILRGYSGSNDIGGSYHGATLERWKGPGDAPHNIRPRMGSVHIAASRDFIDYLLHNDTAMDLLEWVKKTQVPDETYFATLNYNPHLKVPGSYTGDVDDGRHEQSWTRYKIWNPSENNCAGKTVRDICILGVGDLQHLTKSKYLFANKLHYDYQFLAYDCLEAWYFEKVSREMQGHLNFNITIYENKWMVSHHF